MEDCHQLKKQKKVRMPSLWHADHILPVKEGGGETADLAAVQTLCVFCHLLKSNSERKGKDSQTDVKK